MFVAGAATLSVSRDASTLATVRGLDGRLGGVAS
ncbi:hypothetical protein Xcel_3330 [Xylanimonas cellulosilytica DSM 15894]|uniref:Uncharacterized protein n=1 Tax=Xylanimonas cellulosilytica (strain DSM 15894 / JCM 12276 / CECT 5975 / KCTC 9989 / LMG 20990 / NBRC 107835 / XIL07) TaxID=446471 RepID=D1BRR4_XYLCX|nr:hypothetical protein Xcel_3330 [Xylanimonas cellulosilytica DSM 15894]